MLNEKQQAHLAAMQEGADLEWLFNDTDDYDKGGAWFLYNEEADAKDSNYRLEPVSVDDAIALQESGHLEQLTVIGDVWGYKHEQ